MKRLLLCMLLAAAAPAQAALEVFACEPEWGALVRALGAEDVDVYEATTALQDVHKIQARPSLIARYRQADLVVCTGAEMEIGWLPALAAKANNGRVRPGQPGYFEASGVVPMLEVPATLDRAHGDVHPYGNPHIQTGPESIGLVAGALTARLALLDPAHADGYRARGKAFAARWAAALEGWRERVRPLRGVAVVSNHRSWVYLYAFTGLHEVATLEPKPGIPPSGAHLEQVLARLEQEPARMVIHASYQDRRPADWLAARAGIPLVELPFSVGGAPGADDLFSFYEVIFTRLLAAAGPTP